MAKSKSGRRKLQKKKAKRKGSRGKSPQHENLQPQVPITEGQQQNTAHSEPQQTQKTGKQKRKPNRHVKFVAIFFESAFQIVTWVCIGLSIGAIFYYASKDNQMGMRLSGIALAVSIIFMIALVIQRVKVIEPITLSPKSIKLFGAGIDQEITIRNTTDTTFYDVVLDVIIDSPQVTNSQIELDIPMRDSTLLGTKTDGYIISKDMVLDLGDKRINLHIRRLKGKETLSVKLTSSHPELSPLPDTHSLLLNIGSYTEDASPTYRLPDAVAGRFTIPPRGD